MKAAQASYLPAFSGLGQGMVELAHRSGFTAQGRAAALVTSLADPDLGSLGRWDRHPAPFDLALLVALLRLSKPDALSRLR